MTTPELETLAESLGERPFRGRQIASWIYKKNIASISEMTDLPEPFRNRLELHRAQVVGVQEARDGTKKLLLEFADGERVEAVFLPYKERVTACVSTQVGCPVGCSFCATGIGGLVRNLTAGEIVDEVLTLEKEGARRVSHVVYMGMGEPLANYDNVIRSIRILNEEVGISERHITLSTVGLIAKIEMLAKEKLQITLAVSLHAPNDGIRRRLVPLAVRNPIERLVGACRRYSEATRRRVTYEYMLIHGVNDSNDHARELAALLRGTMCNVNLIPYNMVEGLPYARPTRERVEAFRGVLESCGITVTQRMERGHSISAACGQLRRKSKKA
ncbi:MAG: 23S rRNA (adenine(2503)-C(2))-methyltransferase RlmN [Armatimonadota bacterium]